MSTILQTPIPTDILNSLQAAGYSSQRLSTEAGRHLAAALFARHTLTLEQAARLAQMPLRDFIPFLGEQNIPVADYDDDEIAIELENALWLTQTATPSSP